MTDPDIAFYCRPSEQIGDRYEVLCNIDKGKFGKVIKIVDLDDNNKVYAAKISRKKQFDIDNAKIEAKYMEKLGEPLAFDNEGYENIMDLVDYFLYEERAVIVTELLSLNLHTYQKMMI